MRKHLLRPTAVLGLAAFVILVIGHYVIYAQTAITGTWTADTRTGKEEKAENAGKIHLSFERRTDHGSNQNGQSYAYDELQGLTRDGAQNGKVSFRLVRE